MLGEFYFHFSVIALLMSLSTVIVVINAVLVMSCEVCLVSNKTRSSFRVMDTNKDINQNAAGESNLPEVNPSKTLSKSVTYK